MTTETKAGTEREYNLTCKIFVIKKTFRDFQSTGHFQNENFFVYLIPVLNSEAYGFFDAWLPMNNDEQVEIPLSLRHPFNTNARGCVRRADEFVPFNHIHLMSYGLAQLIVDQKKVFHGKEILVTVMDEHSDSMADLTVKGEVPFELKKYESKEDSHLGNAVGAYNGQQVYAADAQNRVNSVTDRPIEI
jgi:hypothetical protein